MKTTGFHTPQPNAGQLLRFARIDLKLREGKFPTAKELAASCSCSERTIERDVARLKDKHGAPIYFDYNHGGYAYSDPTFTLPAIRMTQGELLAIFLAEQLLAQYANTPLHQRLASAFRKISSFLPEEVSLDFHDLASTISFHPGPVRDQAREGVFDLLTAAIAERRTVAMRYFSQYRNASTEREVDPYHLQNQQGDWYMIGYCHWRKGLRDFALTRIQELRALERTFAIPATFDKEAYLKQQFGIEKGGSPQEVILKFSPQQARWMREKAWHQTEQKISNADGSLLLKMFVPVTSELKRWVMQYGADVEVLGPEELRDMVKREVEALAERYQSHVARA
ncbi:WYL domain-containing transcriptional regulator [candidate division KSB1 bacterium]|nr:WYL domain-containing transcriptional regulator [candidate division KSB1 bacterium]